MSVSIKVLNRETNKRSELKTLRMDGKIPASVTGKKIPPVSIAVEERELLQLLRSHAHEVMEMNVPGHGKQSVLLKEVQLDKVNGGKLLHVDFHQINMEDPVRTTVAIEFVGEPAGGIEGVIMQQLLAEIEVKALPKDLPSVIQADVSRMNIGDKLLVEDLSIPDSLELLSDPIALVATVLQVRQTTEAENEEMLSETEDKGGLKESSEVKLSDRPNAEDAVKETAGV